MFARCLVLIALFWAAPAWSASIPDATGRQVEIPNTIHRVLAAGPPAAVLLAAIAPDLMIGWPGPLSSEARPLLPPAVANLDPVPRLTGREDVTAAIVALKPDLIIDYGTVNPRYAALAEDTQRRTGIPTILLDGALGNIPRVARMLGTALHREARAEAVARQAEALLALPAPSSHPRVVYARAADGLNVAAAGTDVTEVFTRLGWTVLAPDGQGAFRRASIEQIRGLDPDWLIFSDPAMRQELVTEPGWRSVRAVREGHALVAPALPFGWIEEPPSINRLLGLGWLSGGDPAALATAFSIQVYDRPWGTAERDAILAGIPILPH